MEKGERIHAPRWWCSQQSILQLANILFQLLQWCSYCHVDLKARKQYSVQIIIWRDIFYTIVSHCKYERRFFLPLQGCPQFSAAWSVHEYFLLFPGPSDMWRRSSVTYCKIQWIKSNLNDADKSWDRKSIFTPWKSDENHAVQHKRS